MRRGRIAPAIAISLMLLSAAVITAAESPVLSPVAFLSGDVASGPAAFDQFDPEVVQGDNGYLVVWTDSRTDAGRQSGSTYGGNGSEIYAARLDAGGSLVDPTPVSVTQSPGEQIRPQAAWNGQNWLVVWLSQEPTEGYYGNRVMAARVSPAGTVLDAPIAISHFGSDIREFAVSSDGNQWAVVWEGSSAGDAALMAARISATGGLLDAGGKVILPEAYYSRSNLDLVFGGDEFLLIWQAINTVQGLRLKGDLTPIDAAPFDISSQDYSLSGGQAASNGTDFFVVWEASTSTTYYGGIRGARVNHAGQTPDANEIVIWEDYGGFTGRSPRVVWGGSHWYVSFLLNGITVLRVSIQGQVIDPSDIPADFSNTSYKWSPDSAPAFAGGIQLTWCDTRAGGSYPKDIYAAPVAADRTVGTESIVSNGQPSQLAPRVAANGEGYLVAFRSDVSGNRQVRVQLVGATGNPLWTEPLSVATSPAVDEVAVAWNGTLYLVVWNDTASDQILGRRVRGDGSFADAAPFVVMRGREPAIAAVGDTVLVVGTHAPTYWQYRFTFAVRIQGSTGIVLDSPLQLGNLYAQDPDVAAYSDRWIAVWERHPSHDDPTTEIKGNYINTGGAIGSEFSVRTDFYTVRFHNNPTVATDGATALVVWEDPRVGFGDWNLYGRRVQANGTLLDGNGGLALVTAPANQGRASVAWDGVQFVLMYEDQRNNTLFYDPSTDIYASRVDSAGITADAQGFPVLEDVMPSVFPDVGGAGGRALLAASLYRNVAPVMAYRVGSRVLGAATLDPIITLSGSDVILSWRMTAQGTTCEIWRAVAPYFSLDPAHAELAGNVTPCEAGDQTWRDTGRSGDPDVNYTYRIKATGLPQGDLISDGDSEFDFRVVHP